ncbi:MAG: AAA family ATPase [Polyangiales bacterium]
MSIDKVRDELRVYIRARYPALWLSTDEEERTARMLAALGGELKRPVLSWTCTTGFDEARFVLDRAVTPRGIPDAPPPAPIRQPEKALEHLIQHPEKALFVLHDLHPYLEDPVIVRKLRDAVSHARRAFKTILIVSPITKIPEELARDITVIDVPPPDERELASLLRSFIESLRSVGRVTVDDDPTLFERVVHAARGLTETQAIQAFSRAAVNDMRFGLDDLPLILDEKKQIVRRSGSLEYFDHDESLSTVGGIDGLKQWLASRTRAFGDKAREYGLPQPRGVLLLGVQGCGKSLTAKAIASHWRLPLLRLDVGSVFSPYVGGSEANMRKALATAEALAPVVLWLDEVEKGFGGTSGSGNADAGASLRVFSTFLTWMQERKRPVFVVATANRIAELPPELLRKGRFDEIFFVDLPTAKEREAIFEIHVRKRRRDPRSFDVGAVAKATDGFNGAEVELALVSAMYAAFSAGREVSTDDVLTAARETVALSTTMAEDIAALRMWAKTRARSASGG